MNIVVRGARGFQTDSQSNSVVHGSSHFLSAFIQFKWISKSAFTSIYRKRVHNNDKEHLTDIYGIKNGLSLKKFKSKAYIEFNWTQINIYFWRSKSTCFLLCDGFRILIKIIEGNEILKKCLRYKQILRSNSVIFLVYPTCNFNFASRLLSISFKEYKTS